MTRKTLDELFVGILDDLDAIAEAELAALRRIVARQSRGGNYA